MFFRVYVSMPFDTGGFFRYPISLGMRPSIPIPFPTSRIPRSTFHIPTSPPDGNREVVIMLQIVLLQQCEGGVDPCMVCTHPPLRRMAGRQGR